MHSAWIEHLLCTPTKRRKAQASRSPSPVGQTDRGHMIINCPAAGAVRTGARCPKGKGIASAQEGRSPVAEIRRAEAAELWGAEGWRSGQRPVRAQP